MPKVFLILTSYHAYCLPTSLATNC
uniref:Uncharacterized protein n=1 Tax=Arundo donax TaxID=35708 RepID=A0A0A8ZKL2_ARUDO